MTPERWEEVLRLFERARVLPAAQWEEFLRAECREDAEVAREVLRLLRVTPEPGFLEPPPDASAVRGRQLGEFELIEELGRGGMGVVYKALQRPLKRVVAVKVLMPALTTTPRQLERFKREARAAARLKHTNIVTILTVGVDGDTHYFAMDYVEGKDLGAELVRLRQDMGGSGDSGDGHVHLPSSHAADYFRSVAEIVKQVADGLYFAHQHGIVHRDVKPSNLILDSAGTVRIVDFGLARDEEQGSVITQTDAILGTPHYMSPEQARGSLHRVDHRTDLYSLGVVLFELLTLRRPFEGKTSRDVISAILLRDAPSPRRLNAHIPRDLETICLTAMAKDPDQRYADAAALRDDLERFLEHRAIRARPPSALELVRRAVLRHRRLLLATALVLVAGLIGVLVTVERAHRRRIAEHLSAIAQARAEGPLSGLPLARSLELRGRLADLGRERAVLAAEQEDEVAALERDFEALRAELRARGLSELELGRDPALSEGAREASRLAGLQTLLLASHLFPEDDELRRLSSVESAFPTLAVQARDARGEEIPAQVYLRAADVFTTALGEARMLGSTPLAPLPVLPGYYRLVVAFAAGGFREIVCNPGPATMELALVATRGGDEPPAPPGMVLFPPCDYTFAEYEGERCFQGRTVHLDAFWMDEAEVSNTEYDAFVRATGHVLPRGWQILGDELGAFLARYGDHPVASCTYVDAVAYAEWAGKRLPTLAEWHRAAGGLENRPFPYSSDPDAPPRGVVTAPREERRGSQRWTVYQERTAPVRSHPDARTPEGLYHMFGNVAEWTESMAVMQVLDAALTPNPYERFYAGHAWDALAAGRSPRSPATWGIGPHFTDEQIGFRCARSQNP